MMRRLSILPVIALGAGCDGAPERFLTVQPYLYACEQAGSPRLCYKVVEDSAEFRFPYYIRDFQFQWGTTASIYVREYEDNEGLDSPGYRYELERVYELRPDPVGTVYDVELPPSGMFYPTTIPGVVNFEGYGVACDDAVPCDALLAWGAQGTASFEYTGVPFVPLRAIAVDPL